MTFAYLTSKTFLVTKNIRIDDISIKIKSKSKNDYYPFKPRGFSHVKSNILLPFFLLLRDSKQPTGCFSLRWTQNKQNLSEAHTVFCIHTDSRLSYITSLMNVPEIHITQGSATEVLNRPPNITIDDSHTCTCSCLLRPSFVWYQGGEDWICQSFPLHVFHYTIFSVRSLHQLLLC